MTPGSSKIPVSSIRLERSHVPEKNVPDSLIADGTCDIQLYLTGTTAAQATLAHASGRMIKAAAQSVLDKCVASRTRMGGVASNIGT